VTDHANNIYDMISNLSAKETQSCLSLIIVFHFMSLQNTVLGLAKDRLHGSGPPGGPAERLSQPYNKLECGIPKARRSAGPAGGPLPWRRSFGGKDKRFL
jgi:hypothetical protein